jgi:indole-3-glycerol phosphate synthase
MRSDIETLMKAGIHAFLIGETLMRSENIGKKLSELLGKA